jgi:hypothetical protein
MHTDMQNLSLIVFFGGFSEAHSFLSMTSIVFGEFEGNVVAKKCYGEAHPMEL